MNSTTLLAAAIVLAIIGLIYAWSRHGERADKPATPAAPAPPPAEWPHEVLCCIDNVKVGNTYFDVSSGQRLLVHYCIDPHTFAGYWVDDTSTNPTSYVVYDYELNY